MLLTQEYTAGRTSARCCRRCRTRRSRSCGTARAAFRWRWRARRSTGACGTVRRALDAPARELPVLDFGCGWGRLTRYLARDVAPGRLFGCDPVDVDPRRCRETPRPGHPRAVARSCRERCRSTSASIWRLRSRSSPICPRTRARALPRCAARRAGAGRHPRGHDPAARVPPLLRVRCTRCSPSSARIRPRGSTSPLPVRTARRRPGASAA